MLDALVERLKYVPGIVAIAVGGSRARGTADPSSDTDLGLYYQAGSPLDVAVLDAIAARLNLLIAEKPAKRSDVTYVAGCLFQCIGCLLQILFALNQQHWMNEKGAVMLAGQFALVPARFEERVEGAWRLLKADPASLQDAIRIVRELTEEAAALVRREGLE